MSNGNTGPPDDPDDLASVRGGSCVNFGMSCRSSVRAESMKRVFKSILFRYRGFRLALRRVERVPGPAERKYRE